MNRGCCNRCGYKADYITDYNNYKDKGHKNIKFTLIMANGGNLNLAKYIKELLMI